MDVIEQLDEILPRLSGYAQRVTPEQYGAPTPCASFAVRDLFDHMIGGAGQFAPQLRGESPREVDFASLSDEDRPAALRAALDELLAATKAPGAMERTVRLPFGEVPGEVLARFLTVDGMVHTWDLARGTGQDYEPTEELAAEVLDTARQLIVPEMRDGDTFGAEVPVSADAPAITRLVAFTGRAV